MDVALERQNRLIVERLRRALDGVIAVYRFGSSAGGTTTRSSDTDLAVLARARIPAARRFDIQEALAGELGGDVDLLDLAGASTVMAMQVIAGGQLLCDDDSEARGRFEDLTFSAYARLNEERRGILERVAAEKTVYGR
ncbi:MAG: nucleotidyltransferase domain-containing protein [Acidobacteria bacterium]|nr:nucleotidyltransferase domain-containing protein [Acidobacteriota bacterium]